MESLRVLITSVKKNIAGIGAWIVLILFNTRSGEPWLNMIKMFLDVVLAAMIIRNNAIEKKVAFGIAIASSVVTFMDINPWLEFLLLVLFVMGGGAALYYFTTTNDGYHDISNHDNFVFTEATPVYWEERNRLNPWIEKYSYSADEGVNIRKGFLRRIYVNIPTNNIRMRIDQTLFQRMFGLCNVSFFNNFNGELYGDEILHNIKIQSAQTLKNMI